MTRVTARSFSAWALTRKPGVSCSTSSGMPNESHRHTKLTALRQHSGVRPPAIRIGALASDADRDAAQAAEGGDDVAGVGRLELEEAARVAEPSDDGLHVVGALAAGRDEVGDLVVVVEAQVGVGHRQRAAGVGREVGQEPAGQRVGLVGRGGDRVDLAAGHRGQQRGRAAVGRGSGGGGAGFHRGRSGPGGCRRAGPGSRTGRRRTPRHLRCRPAPWTPRGWPAGARAGTGTRLGAERPGALGAGLTGPGGQVGHGVALGDLDVGTALLQRHLVQPGGLARAAPGRGGHAVVVHGHRDRQAVEGGVTADDAAAVGPGLGRGHLLDEGGEGAYFEERTGVGRTRRCARGPCDGPRRGSRRPLPGRPCGR